jgi:hypothetical protein
MPDRFTIVFLAVLWLTMLCGATACIIALRTKEPAQPMQTELFKTCCAIFQTGVGAIIGLLGGHALS